MMFEGLSTLALEFREYSFGLTIRKCFSFPFRKEKKKAWWFLLCSCMVLWLFTAAREEMLWTAIGNGLSNCGQNSDKIEKKKKIHLLKSNKILLLLLESIILSHKLAHQLYKACVQTVEKLNEVFIYVCICTWHSTTDKTTNAYKITKFSRSKIFEPKIFKALCLIGKKLIQ